MVERGKRPEFQTGAPEIKVAPEFPGDDSSSSFEHNPAGLPSATPEITPAPSVSSPESRLPSDGEPVIHSHDQTVGFEEIPKGENTLRDQDTVDAVFEREARSQ
ncbi:MAG: hypothetical protein AAB669_03495 [Patescibacteria group bacterium]